MRLHRFSAKGETHFLPGCRQPMRFAGVLAGACLLALISVPLTVASGQVTTLPKPTGLPIVIRGTLGMLGEKGPELRTAQREYVLRGRSPYILHVLEDKRLFNQELQLEGTPAADGTLVVSRVYAVRNGKLYKIQYFCEVCNITYVQPGHCYCCGRETKLQEVPASPGN